MLREINQPTNQPIHRPKRSATHYTTLTTVELLGKSIPSLCSGLLAVSQWPAVHVLTSRVASCNITLCSSYLDCPCAVVLGCLAIASASTFANNMHGRALARTGPNGLPLALRCWCDMLNDVRLLHLVGGSGGNTIRAHQP